jgi:hypothetical protein
MILMIHSWTKRSVPYIRSMSRSQTSVLKRARRALRTEEDLLVALRKRRENGVRRVELQWLDGAGELHYEVLSPAQSWPYLSKN